VENPPGQVSKIGVAEFKICVVTFQFRDAELQNRLATFHPPRLGSLGPPSLAINTSYFASFSLIIWILDDFLDENCSSGSILAFCHYSAFLGWLISVAQ
jgi:hypothetical protein